MSKITCFKSNVSKVRLNWEVRESHLCGNRPGLSSLLLYHKGLTQPFIQQAFN